MKNKRKFSLRQLCVLLGIGLMAAAVAVTVAWQWGMNIWQEKAEDYVQTIRALIPEPQGALLEARMDNTMPALSIDETDFVGLLEMPGYGLSVPVGEEWGKVSRYPCRLDGSIYDRTMQVGGTSQKGQFDFYREIELGDAVYFTDMEGNRFSYQVTGIRYEDHPDQEALHREEGALTLLIKNIYSFDYIVVFCNDPA